MKNANLKIQKLPSDFMSKPALSIKRFSGEPIGLILSSGEFIPVDGTELYIAEMSAILNIMENFPLFYDNLQEVIK